MSSPRARRRRWAVRQTAPESCAHVAKTQEAASVKPPAPTTMKPHTDPREVNVPGPKTAERKRLRLWGPADDHEPSLSRKPPVLLRDFVGDGPAAPSQAPRTVIWDDTRRTFAFHWPKAFCSDKNMEVRHMFQSMLKSAGEAGSPWEALTNKSGEITRLTCWWTANICSCNYRYGGADVAALKGSFNRIMDRLTEIVMGTLFPKLPRRRWPDSANINLYEDGSQGVGWHSDNEKRFQGQEKEDSDVTTISLSLGCTREFWLALKTARETNGRLNESPDRGTVIEVDLADGDILTMEGLCQKHCVHFVPRGDNTSDSSPRINITWRWVRRHDKNCAVLSDTKAGPAASVLRRSTSQNVASSPCVEVLEWWRGKGTGIISWRKCIVCRHDAWQKGRMCIDGYCRRCWATWSKQDAAAAQPDEKTIAEPYAMSTQRETATSLSCGSDALEECQLQEAIEFSADPQAQPQEAGLHCSGRRDPLVAALPAESAEAVPCAAGGQQRRVLTDYLKKSCERLNSPGSAPGADQLRDHIIPTVIAGVKQWSTDAPASVRQRLNAALMAGQGTGRAGADLLTFRESLVACLEIIGEGTVHDINAGGALSDAEDHRSKDGARQSDASQRLQNLKKAVAKKLRQGKSTTALDLWIRRSDVVLCRKQQADFDEDDFVGMILRTTRHRVA